MTPNTLARTAAAALLALALSACGADPVSPTPDVQVSPEASAAVSFVSTDPTVAEGIRRDVPLAKPVTAGAYIGLLGGSVTVPGTGLRLIVPPAAVLKRTYFKVTALPGRLVAYEFEPHGARFVLPLTFEQNLNGTNWREEVAAGRKIEVVYFRDVTQLLPLVGALVNEILPALLDPNKAVVRSSIWHFSGYMVSSGRKAR